MIKINDVISDSLNLDKIYVNNIIDKSNYYYCHFTLKKHSGGERNIYHPNAELKTLQYWLIKNIFASFPVSKYAFAYKKGDSIKKHALQHAKSKHFLHVDIENFFESINKDMLVNLLKRNKKTFEEKKINLSSSVNDICNICLYKNKLCIGAISSPIISNAIMFEFDEEVSKYCNDNNLKYSRYSDDIYISSMKYIDLNIFHYITNKLNNYKFKINNKKTKFVSSKSKRIVTGLIITNESKVSVGIEMRKKIKKMVYKKLKYNIGDSKQILGYLAYLKDIEPNTYDNMLIKYSKYGEVIKMLSS